MNFLHSAKVKNVLQRYNLRRYNDLCTSLLVDDICAAHIYRSFLRTLNKMNLLKDIAILDDELALLSEHVLRRRAVLTNRFREYAHKHMNALVDDLFEHDELLTQENLQLFYAERLYDSENRWIVYNHQGEWYEQIDKIPMNDLNAEERRGLAVTVYLMRQYFNECDICRHVYDTSKIENSKYRSLQHSISFHRRFSNPRSVKKLLQRELEIAEQNRRKHLARMVLQKWRNFTYRPDGKAFSKARKNFLITLKLT